MSREKLVPRFYGSEIEYGYTPDISGLSNKFPPGIKRQGTFLENGGKLYIDCRLIEYATPECPTLDDVVTHEIAGERLVWDAYGDGKSPVNTLHKRVLTPNGKHSSGAHENYSTINLIWEDDGKSESNIQSLATHFATRTIFMGAGQPTDQGYVLGQKIQHLNSRWHESPDALEKPLVDTKNEPHAGGSPLRRLQVSSGDANLSPWATRMKFGTTSLVLRLLEHDVDLQDMQFPNPIRVARRVASGVDGMNSRFKLRSGKFAKAVDIQESLAMRAEQLSQQIELPQEEQAIIPEWFTVVDALRRYTKSGEHQDALRQIDWYAKKQLIDRDRERKGEITRDREDEIGLVYDQIPDGGGIRMRRNPKWFGPHAPQEEAVQKAKTVPPEGRAKMRGAYIKREVRKDSVATGWDSVLGRKLPLAANYSEEEIAKRLSEIFEE